MNKNIIEKKDVVFENIPIIGMWFSYNETRLSFGLRTKLKNRNIRLTTFCDGNVLNTHLKDSGKEKELIWFNEIPISEVIEIAHELQNTLLKQYYWFQTYFQFSEKLFETLINSGRTFEEKNKDYDISIFIKAFLTENSLIKKRIRKGYYEGKKPGFIFQKDNVYLVFPYEKKKMLIMNADLRKTPLYKFPTVEGLYKFFDHIEKEEILENSPRYNEEHWKQLQAAYISLLSQKGFLIDE